MSKTCPDPSAFWRRWEPRTAVCLKCLRPLRNPWRSGWPLCWQCGIDDELFRRETRWMDEADRWQPPSRNGPRPSWWRRLLDRLRKARQVGP